MFDDDDSVYSEIRKCYREIYVLHEKIDFAKATINNNYTLFNKNEKLQLIQECQDKIAQTKLKILLLGGNA